MKMFNCKVAPNGQIYAKFQYEVRMMTQHYYQCALGRGINWFYLSLNPNRKANIRFGVVPQTLSSQDLINRININQSIKKNIKS